ncbi:MAG TPA: amidohydrolase family protein [Myxococcota bacterium]|nr:amidohydrolase family protein [Myxococcota bacterium]HRY94172.1 amidohydrolase family protein [Myxococcota bacterium]HSA20496.1 amidohydrolase family protein [Myxococcota bacterium]
MSDVRLLLARRVLRPDAPPLDDAGVAVQAGRILAAAPTVELRARFPGARVRDLAGATLAPAFQDAHLHLLEMVQRATAAALGGVREADELVARLARAPAGSWALGFELNLHAFQGFGGTPRALLDRAVPDRPCAVASTDLHSLFANSRALAAAGLDPRGEGALQEADAEPLRQALPRLEGPALRAGLAVLAAELRGQGITRVQDFSGLALDRALWEAPDPAWLPLEVATSLLAHELGAPGAADFRSGDRRGRVTRGYLKLFGDGSLGSRTAWMLRPYLGRIDTGRATFRDAELAELVADAHRAGRRVALHAIGEAAVRQAARVLGPGDRLEHGQHVHPDDLAGLGRAGVCVCVNPAHLALDWQACLALLPQGGQGAYPLASLRRAGVPLVVGSDAPVVPARPWTAVRWAVQRATRDGQPAGGFHPEEGLSLGEALCLSWDPASRLRPGDPADLCALDGDPFEGAPDGLEDVRCLECFLEGEGQPAVGRSR